MINPVWVYALEFENGSRYVGLTKDLTRRMEEHRRRQSPSTRRLPGQFKLTYQQTFKSYVEARRHEKFLKSGHGRRLYRVPVGELNARRVLRDRGFATWNVVKIPAT